MDIHYAFAMAHANRVIYNIRSLLTERLLGWTAGSVSQCLLCNREDQQHPHRQPGAVTCLLGRWGIEKRRGFLAAVLAKSVNA